MSNIGLLLKSPLKNSWGICRNFSVSSSSNKSYSCKLLVVGGGSGGCTMAARLAKRPEVQSSVIILEPSPNHYYQPLWTLVGAGVKTLAQTHRSMQSVLPKGPLWLQDRAEMIMPIQNQVITGNGDVINYEFIIIAVGLKYDYNKIPGLQRALDAPYSAVSTIYDARYVCKTWEDLRRFKHGNAIFTYPDTPIKCPGAPQKIAYLTDSYFTKRGIRSKAKIMYNTFTPAIFGVKKYADALLKVVERKSIIVNYKTVLIALDPENKQATFRVNDENKTEFEMGYDMLHAVPPMSTPDVLAKNGLLADDAGYLDVDKHSLRSTKFPNVFGLGDCTNTPNSKTAAAIAKQSFILEQNVLQSMRDEQPTHSYDGYGACPLVTSYSTCILAEFLYGGVVHETFPFDQLFQSCESTLAYYMKRDLFPFIYWHFMLKGRYGGPEFVRKIFHNSLTQRLFQSYAKAK